FGLGWFALWRLSRLVALHLLGGSADDDLSSTCLATWRIDQDVDDERTVLAQLRPRLGGGRCGPRRWLGGLLGKVHASLRVNPPATQTSWLVSIGSLRMRLPVSLNKALVSAGITGGNAGSPMPVGALSDLTNST